MRTFIQFFFPWVIRVRRANQLAREAEACARRLSGLPPASAGAGVPAGLLDRLASTCQLLRALVERGTSAQKKGEDVCPPAPADGRLSVPGPTKVPRRSTQDQEIIREGQPNPPVRTDAALAKAGEPLEPPAGARELIQVRDHLLSLSSGTATPSPAVLQVLYRKLGKALEKEGIATLEETGAFKGDLQEVSATQHTDDPAQHETVCATVRPGYAFRGRVIRPQEVILYVCEDGRPEQRDSNPPDRDQSLWTYG
jgi:hypothetical protein